MFRRVMMIAVVLIGTGATLNAHAVGVTTYGTGLKTCAAYLQAREQQNADELPFVDWLSGYLSGVNVTASRFNNMLHNPNPKDAVYWVAGYCQQRPAMLYSAVAFMLLLNSSASSATHTNEPATYGAGFKTCATYLDAREQRNGEDMAFVDWLGGYLSGVNAMSKSTTDVLGTSDLASAIFWLDSYCREHAPARFAEAVYARVTAGITAVAQAAPPAGR
jgi:hypothetical protein